MNRTPVHFNPNTEQPGGDLFVAKITAVGDAAADGTTPYAWQEQRFDPGSRLYKDMESGGRDGTLLIRPAYDLNGRSVPPGTLVSMRLRGWCDLGALAGGQESGQVYDIVRPCGCAGPGGGGGVCCQGNPQFPSILYAAFTVTVPISCPSLDGLIVPLIRGFPGPYYHGCGIYGSNCNIAVFISCLPHLQEFVIRVWLIQNFSEQPCVESGGTSDIEVILEGSYISIFPCRVQRPIDVQQTFPELIFLGSNPFGFGCCLGLINGSRNPLKVRVFE